MYRGSVLLYCTCHWMNNLNSSFVPALHYWLIGKLQNIIMAMIAECLHFGNLVSLNTQVQMCWMSTVFTLTLTPTWVGQRTKHSVNKTCIARFVQWTAFFSKPQQPLQFLEVPVHEGYLLVHEGYILFMGVIFWFMGYMYSIQYADWVSSLSELNSLFRIWTSLSIVLENWCPAGKGVTWTWWLARASNKSLLVVLRLTSWDPASTMSLWGILYFKASSLNHRHSFANINNVEADGPRDDICG